MEEEERWQMKREEWKQELAHQSQGEHSFDLFNSPSSSPLSLPSPLQFTIGCSPQERTSTPQVKYLFYYCSINFFSSSTA